jgi:hypothetical protein
LIANLQLAPSPALELAGSGSIKHSDLTDLTNRSA